jgi:[acyl-carrier-protein] S-malonyltransferase
MKFAFVFPGQGSQSVGMMDAWSEHPASMQVIAQASAALGEDLGDLMAQGPAEQLSLTSNTQPAMLTADVAMYEAWCAAGGPKASLMAGHSLGEYAALTAAGAMTLADAVRVVRIRADAMQAAVPLGVGAMAAVLGLEDHLVQQACLEAAQGEVVEAVNFNAPAQVVIAGHATAVQRAIVTSKAAGAKRAMLLPVSAPFHSSLLQPVAEVLASALANIQVVTPATAVINNVDVAIEQTPDAIRDALVRQAWHAVRWVEVIEAMKAQGITHIIECGPGKALSGMVKRIAPELVALSITDPDSMQVALDTLAAA